MDRSRPLHCEAQAAQRLTERELLALLQKAATRASAPAAREGRDGGEAPLGFWRWTLCVLLCSFGAFCQGMLGLENFLQTNGFSIQPLKKAKRSRGAESNRDSLRLGCPLGVVVLCVLPFCPRALLSPADPSHPEHPTPPPLKLSHPSHPPHPPSRPP